MLPLRRAVLAVFSSAVLLGLAWGCSASNDASSSAGPSGGGSPGIGEAGNDEQVLRPGTGDAGAGSLDLNPLCGKAPRCVPDRPGECAGYMPPVVSLGDASIDAPAVDTADSAGPFSAQAGQSSVGGAAGESSLGPGGAGGEGGVGGAGGESGGGVASAGAAGAPSPGVSTFSCQVQRLPDAPDSVVSQCAPVGSGGVNAPCLTSQDCGWDEKQGALGCVGDATSGLCAPYCCKGDDTCAVGSYCAERPLRDALSNGDAAAPAVMIPVCVPAQNCDLSTPYPCPAGTDCTCKADMACVVVRADGTTTCAAPGAGKLGDACPCAWGFVCSAATNPNQCLQLCYTRGAPSCVGGTCQASAELPDGWGVCVAASLPIPG